MRTRFGRRRNRGGSETTETAIDESWLGRVAESGLLPLSSLTPREIPDVPPSLARIGVGEGEDGSAWLVAVSPRSGGDALLAAAAAGAALVREDFAGAVAAVSPVWDVTDRRRLGSLTRPALAVRAVAAPALAAGEIGVAPEVFATAGVLAPEQVSAQVSDPRQRALFARAVEGLRGLAAKHGGAVRGHGSNVELAILARRVAVLQAEPGAVVLEALLPSRSRQTLDETHLAEALDRLEGYIRKRLGDRKIRDGEEGLRGQLVPGLAAAGGLRSMQPWPVGGRDLDVLDLVGLGAEGEPVVGAVRERLTLAEVGRILDAALALDQALPILLADAEPPVRLGAPRLLLASRETAASVDDLLSQLALGATRLAIGAGNDLVSASDSAAAPLSMPAPARRGRRPRRDDEDRERPREARGERSSRVDGEARESRGDEAARESRGDESSREGRDDDGAGRRPRRRRRGRGGRRVAEGSDSGEDTASGAAAAEDPGGFDEISLFDLEDDTRPGSETNDGEGGSGSRGRRRRGGRRRGRRSESSTRANDSPPERDADADDSGDRGRRRRRPRAASRADLESDDAVVPLADAPDLEEDLESDYDESELQEEPLSQGERLRLERERRRLARVAKAGPVLDPAPKDEPEAEPDAPRTLRGRAAILAHADPASVAAAVVLAREVRQVEGIWIYPQEDLMTFFRGVAVDLRENTPIYVIGFAAVPARDSIQAASLYRDRILWFDHHAWPPEDRGAMGEAIGAGMLQLETGCDSSLPLVLSVCTRRSRFTDKLVDLATGRFTQHDFERWGRVWWNRLREIAGRRGEQRNAVDPLLAGRPSDLAREAAKVPSPPLPEEVEYVASHDFRLVHFGGLSLALADVPQHLNVHLASRILRERYGAALSLARCENSGSFVLGSDEVNGRRAIDAGSMVDHLDGKFSWVDALPAGDHVARFRIDDLERQPERLDEVIAEIAMGRSILEG